MVDGSLTRWLRWGNPRIAFLGAGFSVGTVYRQGFLRTWTDDFRSCRLCTGDGERGGDLAHAIRGTPSPPPVSFFFP
jgi:hypothetical protein